MGELPTIPHLKLILSVLATMPPLATEWAMNYPVLRFLWGVGKAYVVASPQ